jgi:hypothetical protein
MEWLDNNRPLVLYLWGGLRESPFGTSVRIENALPPLMLMTDERGAVSEITIDRRNRSNRREPAPSPICPP